MSDTCHEGSVTHSSAPIPNMSLLSGWCLEAGGISIEGIYIPVCRR